MHITWVLAADASRARIFQVLDDNQTVTEIETFIHPSGRESDRDLTTAPQGRFRGGGDPSGHSAPERTTPTEHEANVFSKEVSDYLERARNEQRYEHLRLIAPPKFLGMLRQHLTKDAQRLIDKEIPKDISWHDTSEIERYIRNASAKQ
ncbi:MAG TPA: host attachment protein [Burkholderiales bacterium]|jgi:protein required for attachment to host cells|nr:host attachment protein [Burkholderiales bacterium]